MNGSRTAVLTLPRRIATLGLGDFPVIPTAILLVLALTTIFAEAIAPYRDLGFETVIFRLPAPFDLATIERLPDVVAALG